MAHLASREELKASANMAGAAKESAVEVDAQNKGLGFKYSTPDAASSTTFTARSLTASLRDNVIGGGGTSTEPSILSRTRANRGSDLVHAIPAAAANGIDSGSF